jgi:SAM-dependent methyltransferase
MAEFYAPEYPPHQPPEQSRGSRRRGRRRAAQDIGAPHKDGNRLLDFGCGSGKFLQEMNALGYQVLGVDAADSVVLHIREELDLPALAGDLSHPDVRASSFDVITMRQSLEHVHDPQRTLRQARRALAAGGRLYVSVPNIDSLPFRAFGPAWYGLDLPRHLTHFTPTTLREILVRTGFRPGRVRMMPHSSWLQRSAQTAQRLGCGPRWNSLLQSRLACRFLASLCAALRRSDCIAVWAEPA